MRLIGYFMCHIYFISFFLQFWLASKYYTPHTAQCSFVHTVYPHTRMFRNQTCHWGSKEKRKDNINSCWKFSHFPLPIYVLIILSLWLIRLCPVGGMKWKMIIHLVCRSYQPMEPIEMWMTISFSNAFNNYVNEVFKP